MALSGLSILLLIFGTGMLVAGHRRATLQLHHDVSSVWIIWHHLLILRLLTDVEVLVHLLRIVVLDLVLQMIQKKHFWLV